MPMYLEAISESGQCFTNVVRELLVENALEVRCSHSVGHVAVSRMTEKEFTLGRYGQFDILTTFNILLAPVDYTDVAAPQRQQLVFKHFPGVRSFVHQIQFGDDTNRSQTF